MSQVIKLKRSLVSGQIPASSSLELGELALNVADGKAYLRRTDNTVQTLVSTNSMTTGSLNIYGNQTITGSLQVSGNIEINGVDIIDTAVALAIALG